MAETPLKVSKPEAYSMVPWSSMDKVARMYGRGAEKYSAYGWREGYAWSEAFSALMRHASLFWEGEDDDPETREPHMAAVVVHALNLLLFMDEHRDKDDRPRSNATRGGVG